MVGRFDRDVAEIDRIIADIDHGTHRVTLVPAPGARHRVLAQGEGPVYSFKEAATRAFVERRRAGDSDVKVFVDDKPFTPSSRELWKVGAEKDEIRRWIGEGNMATKKKAAKKSTEKSVKGASKKAPSKKSGKKKDRGIGALVFKLLMKNPSITVEDYVEKVKAAFPGWTPKPGHLSWYRWKAVKNGIIKKPSSKVPAKKTPAKKDKKAKRKK